jgi:hypothetical protein
MSTFPFWSAFTSRSGVMGNKSPRRAETLRPISILPALEVDLCRRGVEGGVIFVILYASLSCSVRLWFLEHTQ